MIPGVSMTHPETSSAPEPALFGCVVQYTGRDAAWLRLTGELDLTTAPQLASRLDEGLTRVRLIVVDLRELTFMDCTALAVIVAAHNRARCSERRLVLIRGPQPVDRLLKLTGLADRMEITDLQSIHAGPIHTERIAPVRMSATGASSDPGRSGTFGPSAATRIRCNLDGEGIM
jgi:anti-sigma B factor antagonist